MLSTPRRAVARSAPVLGAVLAAVLAAVLGAALAVSAAALPSSATHDPAAAAGTRDPYFPLDGNDGYDVRHYDVHDTYRPGTDRLRGRTVLEARATDELATFSLDLVLHADAVQVDGEPAAFTSPGSHELVVEPAEPVAAGDTFTVEVRYHGRPGSVEAVGVRPGVDLWFRSSGETVAMGEPQNAPWWFAANETPEDKATYDLTLRVPRGQEAVSNGSLVSRSAEGDWSTWHWRLEEPVATYMVFFAAGQFHLERGVVGQGAERRPYVHAVSDQLALDDRRTAMRRLALTDDVVAWFESRLRPYPFSDLGGVVVGAQSGYALETASRPVYPWHASRRSSWVALLVHEQAHQWFGNDVALRRWRDIWLNEGFATYAEWWYAAEHGGPGIAEQLAVTYDSIPADRAFWEVRVSDPGPDRMWSDAVYVRGAMTLAALRTRIGADDFATLVDQWLIRNAGGHGTGEQLRALAEEVSGEDLGAFFQHWLDDTVKPAATAENGLGGGGRMQP